MARVMPDVLPDGAVASERAVVDAFRRLPDSWTVLYDVPVGLFGRPSANLRQIDVLLLHERLGIIVVEVKGGEIKVDSGDWYTKPRNSSEWKPLQRSPFAQAADQRFALQRYLGRSKGLPGSAFCHAVAFPGCDVTSDLGPDAPRQLALGMADLRDPTAALHAVRAHWGDTPGISARVLDDVVSELRPTFEMTVLSATAAAVTADGLERETRRQVEMVGSQVRAYHELLSSDRVVVLGGAGTGKTVIAGELAKQMTGTGSRVLLACHRAGVQSFLQTLLKLPATQRAYDGTAPGALHVASWPRIASAVAKAAGRPHVAAQDEHLDEHFLAFRDRLEQPYDVLIIDEAQEFTPRQVEAMTWLLSDPDSSAVHLFADPFQHSGLFSTATRDRLEKNIRYRWTPPPDMQAVMLTMNCRNSTPVAALASEFYPDDAPRAVVDAQPPVFHTVAAASVAAELFRLVSGLIEEEGFLANQLLVVLIGMSFKDVQRAAAHAGVATVPVEDLYRFPLTPKDLRVAAGPPDTVQGLEADVVVVGYAHRSGLRGTLREMYIATTRARTLLHVVSDLTREELVALEVEQAAAGGDGATAPEAGV